MKKILQLSALLVIAAGLLTGCASTPDTLKYSSVKSSGALNAPAGKSLVVVYANGAGVFQKYNVYANDVVVAELESFTFSTYYAAPGALKLGCKNVVGNPYGPGLTGLLYDVKSITLNVEPNQTYFVRLSTFPRDHLSVVSQETGESDLKNYKWVNPNQ